MERNSKGQFVKGCRVGKMTMFKKGQTPWNKGNSLSEKLRKNLRNKNLGKKHSLETRKKMSLSHSGTKAYQWKNGATARNLEIRKSIEYRFWRELVFSRDNWKCQICGERGHHLSLRANHIKRFADYPELRLESTNGITICEYCDIRLVLNREKNWESYFSFNLMNRNIITEKERSLNYGC